MSCCPNRTFLGVVMDTCSGATRTVQPGEKIHIPFPTTVLTGSTTLAAMSQFVFSEGHAAKLPAPQQGLLIAVKNTHATTAVTVTAISGRVEKSSSGVFIAANDGMIFGSDGTDWWIMSQII